jgi:hypothetical protein
MANDATTTIYVYVPREMRDWLSARARRERRSLSSVTARAIEEWRDMTIRAERVDNGPRWTPQANAAVDPNTIEE